jgi:zinc-ribbon domain
MFCAKCGAQIPDDSAFCSKCGAPTKRNAPQAQGAPQTTSAPVIAASGVKSLKCPSCGAPITPKFGEMVITCEYCGTGITLGNSGWTSIQNQTMLPLTVADQGAATDRIKHLMDHGFLHRHLEEESQQEEVTLSYVPYWVIPVSARTNIVAASMAAEVGTVATTAALFGVLAGGGGGRGGSFGGGLLDGVLVGSMMGGGGIGGGGNIRKNYTMDENYNYPIVALKALTEYQPQDYSFNLNDRTLFDISKIPKGIKVLNGDVSADVAKFQAKTLVNQVQAAKAHKQYHMIQQMQTEEDAGEGELMYVPIWFARFSHKGKQIVLVLDGNSGQPVNSIGL